MSLASQSGPHRAFDRAFVCIFDCAFDCAFDRTFDRTFDRAFDCAFDCIPQAAGPFRGGATTRVFSLNLYVTREVSWQSH